jgi:hypothetical protein
VESIAAQGWSRIGPVNQIGRSKFPGEKQEPFKKETRRISRKRTIRVIDLGTGGGTQKAATDHRTE